MGDDNIIVEKMLVNNSAFTSLKDWSLNESMPLGQKRQGVICKRH